MQNRVALKEY